MAYPLLMLQFILALMGFFLFWQSIKYFRKIRQYKRLKSTPFPKVYKKTLQRFYHYSLLPSEYKTKLHLLILLFLEEKEFIGSKVEVTEEMKLIIAFYASLMRLGFEIGEKNKSRTIIVYPRHFIIDDRVSSGGIMQEQRVIAEGQSANGTVVLSWGDIPSDGYISRENVIIHEFAHELDFEDGVADGVPEIDYSNYRSWSEVFSREFLRFRQCIDKAQPLGKYALLGTYAATNEAEFFAVCSERFFQIPAELKREFSEIYEEMKQFYKLDTAVLFPQKYGAFL